MELQSSGQIYLADQRGIVQSSDFLRYATFNYQAYSNEHRQPFGRLLVFNDEALAPQKQINITTSERCYLVLIPVTGELTVRANAFNEVKIDVGEIRSMLLPAGQDVTIINSFNDYAINFLCVQIAADEETVCADSYFDTFDINKLRNILIPLCQHAGLPFLMTIGHFDGRKDAVLQLTDARSTLFAFVLAGAFEVQGRLLHERDGLALWNTSEVDMEALSNDAVILLLELKAG